MTKRKYKTQNRLIKSGGKASTRIVQAGDDGKMIKFASFKKRKCERNGSDTKKITRG